MRCFTCFLLFAVAGVATAEETLEQRLRSHLRKSYDRSSLPPGGVTTVAVKLSITRINLLEAQETMEVDAWVMTKWNDSRLSWSAITAAHVPKLTYSLDDIWHPDIVLSNSLDPSQTGQYPATMALVLPSGDVNHVYPARLRFPCVADLFYWPRDTHKCTAEFGSWVHDRDALDLSTDEDGVQLNFPSSPSRAKGNYTVGSWTVLNTSLTLHLETDPCCDEEYPQVLFTVTVMRSESSEAYNVQVPLIAVSVVTGMVFLLPHPVSAALAALFVLLDLQFLIYASQTVPHAPSHPSLIVKLVSSHLMLAAVVLVISTVVTRINIAPYPSPLPASVRRMISALGPVFCVRGYGPVAPTAAECIKMRDIEAKGASPGPPSAGRGISLADGTNPEDNMKTCCVPSPVLPDNLLLGAIINRFCLLLYYLIIVVTMICCRSVLF